MKLDSTKYNDSLEYKNKLFRYFFQITWKCLTIVFPGRVCTGVKRRLINLFGGECEKGSVIYASCKIFDPRNLRMQSRATIGPNTIIYNVDLIMIGKGSVVSQYTHLNTASHDFRKDHFPLIHSPIEIGANCWVSTDVYIGMGVKLCDEVIIGARSSVFKSIDKPGVYLGSPAKKVKS